MTIPTARLSHLVTENFGSQMGPRTPSEWGQKCSSVRERHYHPPRVLYHDPTCRTARHYEKFALGRRGWRRKVNTYLFRKDERV